MSSKKTSAALNDAEDAYREACEKYGEDSPQARAADDAAFAASDAHLGNNGEPMNRYRAQY